MFPARHSILIEGDSTAGMIEFSCYLASTYLRSGQQVLYIAADVPLAQLRHQLSRFGVNASDLEEDGELVFIECRSTEPAKDAETDSLRSCDMADLDSLLGAATEALSSLSGSFQRVVFYSMTPFFMHHNPHSISIFLETLSLKAKQYGSLTVVIHNDVLSETQVETIEAAVDGVIDVRVDDDFRRYVRIRRMEGLAVKPTWVPLEVVRGDDADSGAFLTWRKGGLSDSD